MTSPTGATDIGETLGDAFRDMVNAADQILSDFAAAEVDRAERLAQTYEWLKDSLGAEHPRVKALETVAVRARDARDKLARATARRRQQRQPTLHEWIVSGEVRNAAGEPLAGLRVRIVGAQREHAALLRGTRTDEHGSFAIVYQGRELAPAGERTPALRLQIEDDSGNVLYLSPDELRIRLGRMDYFEVVLAGTKGRT
jgi:hypothetical protein